MEDVFIREMVEIAFMGTIALIGVTGVAIRLAAKPFLEVRRQNRLEAAEQSAAEQRIRLLEAEMATMQAKMRLLEEGHDFDRLLTRSAHGEEPR